MRVIIVRDEGLPGIVGTFGLVDLSTLPPGVRAIWEGYDDSANTPLSNVEYFQPLIDLWMTPALPLPSPLPAFARTQATALARINAAYQDAINTITAGYPEDEVMSWPTQGAEARAWLSDADAATPWIDGAAASRSITKAEPVDKIIVKAALFNRLQGELTDKRQNLRDRIAALAHRSAQQQWDAIQW